MMYSKCKRCNNDKPTTDHQLCTKCRRITHNDSYTRLYHRWVTFNRNMLSCSWEAFKATFEDLTTSDLHLHNNRVYILSKSETSRLSSKVNPTTGYKRIYYSKVKNWFYWQINVDGKTHTKSNFKSASEAADSLDQFILANDITATLSNGQEHIRKSATYVPADTLKRP